ncbi:MAG: DUF2807 domain-containing protein [Bacteroidia bacterium]|nr:DUF2807 domain-containing protein [Bacteroidia bacterium]
MEKQLKHLFAAICIASLFLFGGCKFADCITGEGSVKSEERTSEAFESIEARGSSNIHIKKGEGFSIVINDHENLLKYFKTEVNSSTLILGFDEDDCINNSKMEVVITMPDLKKIKSLGSGDVTISGGFEGAELTTEILGSGQIQITDSCFYKTLNVSITGSGNTEVKEGKFDKAKIEILGSGSMVIGETTSLDVDIKGSGSVSYYGDPSVKSDITGSGTINKVSK